MTCNFCTGNNEKWEHDCHCVRLDKDRIAWGICCANHTVGPSLMLEEDFHDEAPWARPEDCTCKVKANSKHFRKIREINDTDPT